MNRKLKWLLLRLRLLKHKLQPIQYVAQNRLTQISFEDDELEYLNKILKEFLQDKYISKVKIFKEKRNKISSNYIEE